MTTIQDRIIKDFRDKWTKAPDYHDPNTHQNYPAKYTERMSSLGFFVNMDEVEQFLIKSIKEVEQETRKETIDKYFNEIYTMGRRDGELKKYNASVARIEFDARIDYDKSVIKFRNKK